MPCILLLAFAKHDEIPLAACAMFSTDIDWRSTNTNPAPFYPVPSCPFKHATDNRPPLAGGATFTSNYNTEMHYGWNQNTELLLHSIQYTMSHHSHQDKGCCYPVLVFGSGGRIPLAGRMDLGLMIFGKTLSTNGKRG